MKKNRIVDPRGYVLIRVPEGHHLADCRGLAYEHRLVAEEKIGRRLRMGGIEKGEMVHHINGNPSDNRPENLEIVDGIAGHKLRHRKLDKGRRMPGEDNPTIECICGCGEKFLKYDECGRPRKYYRGHSKVKGTGKRNSKEVVTCPCGCGVVFKKYDHGGRERKCLSGHNSRYAHPMKVKKNDNL